MPTEVASNSTNFQDWFANSDQRKDREKNMEQSGIPLEIRTRRHLKKLGYDAVRTYYVTEEPGKYHELDFQATKNIHTFSLPQGLTLKFQLLLLGDCKHSETDDFFAFEAEEPTLLSSDFPIRLYREDIPVRGNTVGSLATISFHKFQRES
jgi:hypothetical protein